MPDPTPSAAYPSPPGPLFTKLCTIESVREAKADPKSASPLLVGCLADALDQAWRDYSRLLRERDLVYGELNKALGGNAPKAWDRIRCEVDSQSRSAATPCTCTIACIPQGITEEQTCRLQLENEAPTTTLRELLVELARWSRVGERNGDLHTRIASALALDEECRELGRDTSAAGEDGAAQ